ncbi:MAG: acyltransferase [Treponema sp.]|nr:acyltransferase [Treponema sp.]
MCGGGAIVNAYFLFVNGHNAINIGEKLSLGNEVTFICQEGTEINIGSGCQIANNVTIRTSDSHSILDADGKRINNAESIRIGNNVWIGQNVIVLKGTQIADNSVIGCMSVCTKKEYQPNSIYVGSPARLVKTGIHWDARQL